jgi:hypothetical protein
MKEGYAIAPLRVYDFLIKTVYSIPYNQLLLFKVAAGCRS